MAPRVLVVGSGFGGLAALAELLAAGLREVTVLEAAERPGGTWRDNRYPGSGCDVPSHLYSLSRFPNPDWSRKFSPQAEIQRYLERLWALPEHARRLRTRAVVRAARWEEERALWQVTLESGEALEAEVLVVATGQLSRPSEPDLPGRERFRGRSFHAARWPDDDPVAGRRVAVVGTGATAIQLVPELARSAAHLLVVQRTAAWVIPRDDEEYGPKARWCFRRLPGFRLAIRALIWVLMELRILVFLRVGFAVRFLEKAALAHLHAQVPEGELRRLLTPGFPVGCKRVLISDDWYPALQRPNVQLVPSGVASLTATGFVTESGVTHEVDTLVWATGFETTRFLGGLAVEGRGGRRLADDWAEGAEAYRGILVHGYPNLFLLYGPNTNLGHNSILFMLECQARYVTRVLRSMAERGARQVEVLREAQHAENALLQRRLAGTAWAAGCGNWYRTASGKQTNNWPGPTAEYWWRTRRPDPADLRYGKATPVSGAA